MPLSCAIRPSPTFGASQRVPASPLSVKFEMVCPFPSNVPFRLLIGCIVVPLMSISAASSTVPRSSLPPSAANSAALDTIMRSPPLTLLTSCGATACSSANTICGIMVNIIMTASRSAKDFDFHFCCFNFTPPIFYYKSAANGQLPLKLPVRAAFCHFLHQLRRAHVPPSPAAAHRRCP